VFADLAQSSVIAATLPWVALDVALPSRDRAVIVGEAELADVKGVDPHGVVTITKLPRRFDRADDLDPLTSDGQYMTRYMGAVTDLRTGREIELTLQQREVFQSRFDRSTTWQFACGYWWHGGAMEEILAPHRYDFDLPMLVDVHDPAAWRLYMLKGYYSHPERTVRGRLIRKTADGESELSRPEAPDGARSMSVSPDERWLVFSYDLQRWLFLDRTGEYPPTWTRSLVSDPSLDRIRWSPDSR